MVPHPRDSVEGLCYLLSAEDEGRLDRSEGVPTAYQKKWTEVDFYPAAAELLGRKVTEILRYDLMRRETRQSPGNSFGQQPELGGIDHPYRALRQVGARQPAREYIEITYPRQGERTVRTSCRRGQSVPAGNRHQIEAQLSSSLTGGTHGEPARVLVYLSENHVKEGLPWDEYVERMNWGIIDAMDLGISREYFEKAIAPFLESATGFHANGEPKARGVREKKKRSRHITSMKHRKSEEAEVGSERFRNQATLAQAEPMNWETTQETYREYEDYQVS